MKTIIALAAFGLLSTAAMAAPRTDCWQVTGNWNGGEHFTNCADNTGGSATGKARPKKCEHEVSVKN